MCSLPCRAQHDFECAPRCSAHNQRKIYFQICNSGKSADFPELPFHGWGLGTNPLRHLALLDASSPEGGAFCALSPAERGTILNGLRCALAMFSGKIILNFRVCRTLRSATDAFFTGGVVAGNCICSACFLRKRGAAAEHPFRLLTAFAVTFPKGTAFAVKGNFVAVPKASPWGSWHGASRD